jgi:all-trans-retinol dehydrogenase (NAD+)
MIKLNKGHIVNISSMVGILGGDKLSDYCATKFAVYGFSESLRIELKCLNKDNKIKVTTVCPFHIKTPMFEAVKFHHFNWLNVSMEPEYVAKQIIHGILMNKELIYLPRLLSYLCSLFKGFV